MEKEKKKNGCFWRSQILVQFSLMSEEDTKESESHSFSRVQFFGTP